MYFLCFLQRHRILKMTSLSIDCHNEREFQEEDIEESDDEEALLDWDDAHPLVVPLSFDVLPLDQAIQLAREALMRLGYDPPEEGEGGLITLVRYSGQKHIFRTYASFAARVLPPILPEWLDITHLLFNHERAFSPPHVIDDIEFLFPNN